VSFNSSMLETNISFLKKGPNEESYIGLRYVRMNILKSLSIDAVDICYRRAFAFFYLVLIIICLTHMLIVPGHLRCLFSLKLCMVRWHQYL
jgi:hypothetical protein